MRIIKFRAWDKSIGKMVYFEPLHTLYSYRERFKLNAHDTNMGNGLLHDDFIDDYEGLELMQYTGKKDKFGGGIFEGDILRYENGITKPLLLVVEWSQLDVAFNFGGMRADYIIRNGEVIGNLYENPELIGSEQTEVSK